MANCIYKTVTLQAGEKFVLPPGAEIVSVSDTGAVESDCTADLPEAEMKCYRIRWVTNVDTEGPLLYIGGFVTGGVVIPARNNAWDDEESAFRIKISNISVGNVVATAGCGIADLASLEGYFASSGLGGSLMDRKYLAGANTSNDDPGAFPGFAGAFVGGYNWYEMYFKAPEEIALTVYIEAGSEDNNIADIPRFFAREIDCADYPTTTVVNPQLAVGTTTSTTTTTTIT